jgi:hypothetical protein
VKSPVVRRLSVHDAAIEKDEAHLGKCKGGDVYDGGSEENL